MQFLIENNIFIEKIQLVISISLSYDTFRDSKGKLSIQLIHKYLHPTFEMEKSTQEVDS